jgi:hypothetical protein
MMKVIIIDVTGHSYSRSFKDVRGFVTTTLITTFSHIGTIIAYPQFLIVSLYFELDFIDNYSLSVATKNFKIINFILENGGTIQENSSANLASCSFD